MTEQEVYSIERFTETLPDYLADHWNEIIEIIEDYSRFDYINDSLMNENSILKSALQKTILNILIFEKWIDEGKINTKTGFKNYCHFMRQQIIDQIK